MQGDPAFIRLALLSKVTSAINSNCDNWYGIQVSSRELSLLAQGLNCVKVLRFARTAFWSIAQSLNHRVINPHLGFFPFFFFFRSVLNFGFIWQLSFSFSITNWYQNLPLSLSCITTTILSYISFKPQKHTWYESEKTNLPVLCKTTLTWW